MWAIPLDIFCLLFYNFYEKGARIMNQQIKAEQMTPEQMLWAYGGEILRSETMGREKTIPQHGSTTCYDHSVGVALCSIRLARRWGWRVDYPSLVRGALLHDYFLYNWREPGDHRLHGLFHARRAMENAQRDFGLNAVEADIIRRHMFPLNPTPPRYKESVVVTWADKLCAVREMWAFVREHLAHRRLRPGSQR